MSKVRVAAARCLQQVAQGHSLSQALPRAEPNVTEKERALLREICIGTLRFLPQIEGLLKQLLSKPFKPKDLDLKMLLATGLYQLEHMRIPDHAAINETVESTRRMKKRWASGLVNGVLRRFQREKDALFSRLSEAEQLAHPEWLFESYQSAWPEYWRTALTANNDRPPMTLRINQLKQSRVDYLNKLSKAGFEAEATPFSEVGITLTEATDVHRLPDFYAGAVSVQDEAAQLCAELLAPQPGERVLDACCAPGGKTCHLLEKQPELDSLTGLDSDPNRLARVEENLSRLSLSAELIAGDASLPDEWWDGIHYDRILVDAPCSATGVIRRHPDIKLLRKKSDIPKLVALQRNILAALWPLLKSGGTLLYATCSMMPEENEKQIESFLQNTPDAKETVIQTDWGEARPHGRQLFPQSGGHDGFYYALLTKA